MIINYMDELLELDEQNEQDRKVIERVSCTEFYWYVHAREGSVIKLRPSRVSFDRALKELGLC